jgi:hypothetical protein
VNQEAGMKDFYGTEIVELKLKDGTSAKLGDVIRWNCYDNDDNVMWAFTGIYKSNRVTYLGGGIDFGMGIGYDKNIEEIINESEDNDEWAKGVEKVGVVADMARHIQSFNK